MRAVASVAELRRWYLHEKRPLSAAEARALRSDPRKGVAQLLQQLEQRHAQREAERRRQAALLQAESALWAQGCSRVAGVDEVGMSPWAGPIVAAAVVLVAGPPSSQWRLPAGVRDSKQIPEPERERLAEILRSAVFTWAVGSASPAEIARFNVYHAGRLAMRRAVAALRPRPDALLVDAREIPGFDGPQTPIVRGDGASLSIAAASILAKVARDRYLRGMEARHPGYGFASHKGYGTAVHREALRRHGGTPEHRWAFDAVRKAAGTVETEASQASLPFAPVVA